MPDIFLLYSFQSIKKQLEEGAENYSLFKAIQQASLPLRKQQLTPYYLKTEKEHTSFSLSFFSFLFHPYKFVTLHLFLSLITSNFPYTINHCFTHTHKHIHTHTCTHPMVDGWGRAGERDRIKLRRVNKDVVSCLVHNYFPSWLHLVPRSPFPPGGSF